MGSFPTLSKGARKAVLQEMYPVVEGHSQPVMSLRENGREINITTSLSSCPLDSGWCLPLADSDRN